MHRIILLNRLVPIHCSYSCFVPGTLVNALAHLVFIPTTLWDDVGTVIIPLVREETSNLTSVPFHMPLQWRNSVWVSLEKKLWPLGWPPKNLLIWRFYDFCESGIKIRKQNCGSREEKERHYEWINEAWMNKGLQSLLQIISSVFLLYFLACLGHRFVAFV